MEQTPEKTLYPFFLDDQAGQSLAWAFEVLFKRIRIQENMVASLRSLQEGGSVVYATKYRGHMDFLLAYHLYGRLGIPRPNIGFGLDMTLVLPLSTLAGIWKHRLGVLLRERRFPNPMGNGYLKKAVLEGRTLLFCLVDPKGFVRHFVHDQKDMIELLLECQREMERPIHIVPQMIVYKKAPEKEVPSLWDLLFGYQDNAGLIRKTVLFFRHHRQAFVDFGRPLNLLDFLRESPPLRPAEELAVDVRRFLVERIDAQKRVILGPVVKSRQQLKELVLTDPEVTKTIEHMAGQDRRRGLAVRKEAGKVFEKIAADYSAVYIQVGVMFLRWMWRNLFEGIDVKASEMAEVREWARKGPVVYVPSHKSHIDYLVLNYILYEHYTHIPRIAAGENLAFWPMGHFFRKSGAFFIRRSFLGARLYSRVFTRYIKALVQEGYSLEFYIEGGRSRSGKLILPKVGLLSTLLEAQKEGYCEDLIFVPASIGYDRILEEKSYLKEVLGGQKEKESFSQIWKARGILKRKYGRIYIRFGQPLSLKDYLQQARDPAVAKDWGLALRLVRSINRVTLVTPLALVAMAILTRHRRGFQVHELLASVSMLMAFLHRYRVPLANTLGSVEQAVNETLGLLLNWKMLKFLEGVDDEGVFYYIEEEKFRELEYYKNCAVHFFIHHAFVAVSLLSGSEEIRTEASLRDDYAFLQKLFQNEFVYDEDLTDDEQVDEALDFFLETTMITQAERGYHLTRKGFEFLPLWAGLAKTFLEAYWVATRAYMGKGKAGKRKGDLLKGLNPLGVRLHRLGLIDHIEAVSQITFTNAIQYITRNIFLAKGEDKEKAETQAEALAQLGARLHALSQYRI